MQGYHVDDDVLHTRCMHKFDLVLLQARTLGFRVARYLELLSMCTDPLIGPQRNKRTLCINSSRVQRCCWSYISLYIVPASACSARSLRAASCLVANAAGLADRCEIQISYAIGVSEPTSISLDTYGTGKLSEDEISNLVREHFDLRPSGLIQMLDLRRPIYQATAAYGHFGREEENFTWENTDKVALLKKAL